MEKTMKRDDIINFDHKWLLQDRLAFELLTVILIAADEYWSFTGTLENLCEKLLLKSSSRSNKMRVRDALYSLYQKNYVTLHKEDKNKLTIVLTYEASQELIPFKKEWAKLIQLYRTKVNSSWSTTLKLWLCLRHNCDLPYITYDQISEETGLGKAAIGRAKKVLREIGAIDSKFVAFCVTDKDETAFRALGTHYNLYDWSVNLQIKDD